MSYAPPYGGYDPYGNGSQQQQQHGYHEASQQHQQGPSFEGYNPAAARTNNNAYSFSPSALSVPASAAFLPRFIPAGLDYFTQQHRQQQQQRHSSDERSMPAVSSSSVPTPMMTFSTIFDVPQLDPITSVSSAQQADPAQPASDDSWLETIQLTVSEVALEPLSGNEVMKRVRKQTDNVVTCYLPCVEFLVNCQQELRTGLAESKKKRLIRHAYRDSMSPRQFYNRYLAPLCDRFHRRNKHLMEAEVLTKATQEIAELCQNALQVQNQGCEAMKNTFLGGMKDGASWGLRKWLSKNGGALHICNDLECILSACQKLDRGEETTVKLSERLRPMAKQALGRLKSDVPSSYQEISTAHPYLPFFHRLESALKGMANFDPEDDDVICIDDDDEIEEAKTKAKAKKPQAKKRPPAIDTTDLVEPFAKRAKTDFEPVGYDFGRDGTPPIKNPFDSDGDDDSVIEILGVKPPPRSDNSSPVANGGGTDNNDHWRCSRCSMLNIVCSDRCCMCSKIRQEEENCSAEEADNDIFKTFSELAGLPSFEEAAASVSAKIFDYPDPLAQQDTGSEMMNHVNHPPIAAAPAAPQQPIAQGKPMTGNEMIQHLERLVYLFDVNRQDLVRPRTIEKDGFWDSSGDRYARILRLLISLIRDRDCDIFLNAVDQLQVNSAGQRYCDIIKNPLCFRNIVYSLVDMDEAHTKSDGPHQPCGSGILPESGLVRWNMWRGFDLLQAIDLVFLNALAFNGKEKTRVRSQTNRLRRILWDEIHRITKDYFGFFSEEDRRRATPTRRGENSGFVIRKA